MKKVISVLLTLILVLSITCPALAIQTQLTEELGFICEDLPNGDAVFYYEMGTRKLYEAYVSRATNEVICTDYVAGKTSSINFVSSCSPALIQNTSRSYTYAGSILFDYFSDQSDIPQGSRTLRCSYNQDTDIHDSYNINGTYQNAAALAGVICSFFSLPSAVAGALVAKIAAYLGLSLGVGGPLLIPDLDVDCVSITVTWKLQDQNISSFLEYMSGTRYDFVYDGESHTEYSGFYYPAISFRNRDYEFAYRAYNYVYGPGRCSVTGWI